MRRGEARRARRVSSGSVGRSSVGSVKGRGRQIVVGVGEGSLQFAVCGLSCSCSC